MCFSIWTLSVGVLLLTSFRNPIKNGGGALVVDHLRRLLFGPALVVASRFYQGGLVAWKANWSPDFVTQFRSLSPLLLQEGAVLKFQKYPDKCLKPKGSAPPMPVSSGPLIIGAVPRLGFGHPLAPGGRQGTFGPRESRGGVSQAAAGPAGCPRGEGGRHHGGVHH